MSAPDSGAAPELLPCPFCGGKKGLEVRGHSISRLCVECHVCGAVLYGNAVSAEEAVEEWNLRADLATPLTSPQPHQVQSDFMTRTPDESRSSSERQRAPGPCLPHSKPYCEECNKASQESFKAMCAPPSPSREGATRAINVDDHLGAADSCVPGCPILHYESLTGLAGEVRRLREVERAQADYIEFLVEHISKNFTYHGIRDTKDEIEKGKQLRARIAALTNPGATA